MVDGGCNVLLQRDNIGNLQAQEFNLIWQKAVEGINQINNTCVTRDKVIRGNTVLILQLHVEIVDKVVWPTISVKIESATAV